MVSAFSAKEIVASGYNVIKVRESDKQNVTLVMNKHSHLVIIPDLKPNFKDYAMRYPVEVKGKNAILYKAVHKVDGKYLSDYKREFAYQIGETMTHENDPSKENSCSFGLHVSDKAWAKSFGFRWGDVALLECEVPISKIVVSKDCDGKIRTSELKVLREVPREDW